MIPQYLSIHYRNTHICRYHRAVSEYLFDHGIEVGNRSLSDIFGGRKSIVLCSIFECLSETLSKLTLYYGIFRQIF
jgi:hypothetical protein